MGITFEEAVAAYHAGDLATAERGYLAFPSSLNAVHNLATLYRNTGRLDEGETAYRRILAQYPDMQSARRGLSLCLLALRRCAEAWPLYEVRREEPDSPRPLAGYPEWRGEPVAGRRVVVVPEQGLGDQLMFARYVPELAARGAEVVVACDPRALARLFEQAGFATFAYWRDGQTLPAADYWVLGNSLPLRLALAGPPAPAYLPPIEPAAKGGGVGVVATGNPRQVNDRNRSLGPTDAAALKALGRDLLPAATGARDFLETAEIIAGLDLVITVDTSVAHLAGSMGKRCWVLLTAFGLHWPWNDGVRSDWYPAARLFRQPAPGDWTSVIAAVRLALAAGIEG